MDKDIIFELYRKEATVFTLKEITLLFPNLTYKTILNKLIYAIKTNRLKKIRKGIYAKDRFNFLEVANKLYTPSYISFETVLQKEGIVFQVYKTVFVASYLTRNIKLKENEIFYRKLINEVLLNSNGVEKINNYFVATKERAFLDAIFLYKNYHFDNLKPLDWKKITELKKIYQSKTLEKRVDEYYQIFKEEYV